ncbi:MAG: RDD family protein [Acidimicrobiales bacterium]
MVDRERGEGEDRADDLGPAGYGGFDVGGLTPDQRMVLSRVLDEAGIHHDFLGPELQAPGAHSELVELLVERAARATGDDEHDRALFADIVVADDGSGLADGDPYGLPIASRGGRFLAYLLEGVLFGIAIIGLQTVNQGLGRFVGLGVSVVSGLVLVAVMGGTVGMLLYGLRVVAVGRAWEVPVLPIAPGWSVATVRYLVAVWPGLLGQLLWFTGLGEPGWVARISSGWSIICFAPILWDPMRRGLHDRVARTLVVDIRGIERAARGASTDRG